MKKTSRKTPRLPVEALRRLGSHPLTTKKGEKGYQRERAGKEARDMVEEESTKEAMPPAKK